jgi:hypothetical protein
VLWKGVRKSFGDSPLAGQTIHEESVLSECPNWFLFKVGICRNTCQGRIGLPPGVLYLIGIFL